MGPSSPSLHTLHTTHVLTHTDAECSGISSLDREKECLWRPTIARQLIQPGVIPRAGRPWCRPDQSPRPVTSDQPTAQPLSSSPGPTLSLGAECMLGRFKGQGVKGPRGERRKEGLSSLPGSALEQSPCGGRRPAHPIPAVDNGKLKQFWR